MNEARAIGETLAIVMVLLNASMFLSMLSDMRRFNRKQAQRRRERGEG